MIKALESELREYVEKGKPLSERSLDHIRVEFQKFKAKRKPYEETVLFSEFKNDYAVKNMATIGKVDELKALSNSVMRNPPNVSI